MLCETPLQNSVAYRVFIPTLMGLQSIDSFTDSPSGCGLVGFMSVHMYFGGQSKWAATSYSSHGISLKYRK